MMILTSVTIVTVDLNDSPTLNMMEVAARVLHSSNVFDFDEATVRWNEGARCWDVESFAHGEKNFTGQIHVK